MKVGIKPGKQKTAVRWAKIEDKEHQDLKKNKIEKVFHDDYKAESMLTTLQL